MIRHLVLSGGPAHPFDATTSSLSDLANAAGFETEVVTEPTEAIAALRAAEAGEARPVALVTVNALRWRMTQRHYADRRRDLAVDLPPDDLAVIDRFVRRGGGLLAVHTAVICFDADPVWHALCGASWRWDRSTHPPLGPVEVEVTDVGRDHALTEGLAPFVVEDEAYRDLDEIPGLQPLLSTTHQGHRVPLLWARNVGAGRVVTDLLGHGPASVTHPSHRIVLDRAVAWAGGAPASGSARRRTAP